MNSSIVLLGSYFIELHLCVKFYSISPAVVAIYIYSILYI